MNNAWNTFLLEHGAHIDDGVLRDFGDPQTERRAARDGDVLADLSALSLIRASGADARTFLNGQLTNELGLVNATQHQLSAWCSAQGRALALFRVFQRDGDLYLQLPSSLREAILKRLRMFVLRAKVTFEIVDDELIRFGIVGPNAERLAQKAIKDFSLEIGASVTRGTATLLRLPGIHPRFEIIAPPTEAISLWETLRADATPVASGAWYWHDIMTGIPNVFTETSDAFVPQMLNLELVGGVNFKKGCYPGQEIVARMQYLGRLKQRMYRAHVVGDVVAPGTPIFASGANGQSVGNVVDAQPSPNAGVDLLAVIQIASTETALRLRDENGPTLSLQPLPYSVETPTTQKTSA